MAKEVKNENVNPNTEEQKVENPAPETVAEEKKPGKIKSFISKHGGKIKTGLLVAGGIAAGVAVDKFGLKLGKGKKSDDPGSETAAE